MACILIQSAVRIHNVDNRQLVTLAYLEVRRVMARRNLQRASAELKLDSLIANHRDNALQHWQNNILANVLFVAFVLWIHSDGGVAKESFGPRRCDSQSAASIFKFVLDVI